MKKHHAYLVKWRDSSTLRGWQSLEDHRHAVATITSIGWLAQQSPKTITLTTCISECGNVADAITIPREAITKITRLKHYIAGN